MNAYAPVGMSEAERLDNLASMQRLERDARTLREDLGEDRSAWPEDARAAYLDLMQRWYFIKMELQLDEGPFAHVGRAFLTGSPGAASAAPTGEGIGLPRAD